ncbi:hypothetical protein ACR2VI_27940 [Klebsiella pneumoniae]
MNKKLLLSVLATTLLLSGCTIVPGSHLSVSGKNQVTDGDESAENIDQLVDVYPMTPRLVEKLRPAAPQARVNPVLETAVQNYGRCEQVPDMRSSYSSGAHPRGTS